MKKMILITLATIGLTQLTFANETGTLNCQVPTKQKCLYQAELGFCVESAQYEPTPADVDFRDPTNHFAVSGTVTLNKSVKGKGASQVLLITEAEISAQVTDELLYIAKDKVELNVVKVGSPSTGSIRIKGKTRDYLFAVSCK